jgi:serine phosphatase RsbU (regulator of sigma subunit)
VNEEEIKNNTDNYSLNSLQDKETEREYYDYSFSKSIYIIRLSLVMGIILYAGFGVLDSYIAISSREIIWLIRYLVVTPIIFVTLLLSYTGIFKRFMDYLMSLVGLAGGLGIIVMIAVSENAEAGYYYYAGLILVIMWVYTFARLKFKFAVIVSWTIVIIYEIIAIFFQDMLFSDKAFRIFLSNNFFFISANVIGMMVCYLLEDYSKRDFFQQVQINKKKGDLEKERNELKLYNDQFHEELQMARDIQQTLVPVGSSDENIYSIYRPMAPVGGDFFDFLKFREKEKIGIFISDVAGHGVPAALIASMQKSIILSIYSSLKEPADLMTSLNDSLSQFTPRGFMTGFVTAFYGIYNSKNKTIRFSNAGHMPPYIISDDGVEKLTGGKSIPLAMMENEEQNEMNCFYKTAERKIPEKSKILFYTDGLTDVRKNRTEKIFFSEFVEEIIYSKRKMKAEDFLKALYDEIVSFNGSDNFDDDICMICLDIT